MLSDVACYLQVLTLSGARAGALSALTFGGLRKPHLKDGMHVMPIIKHKTSASTGPAPLSVKPDGLTLLQEFSAVVAATLGYDTVDSVPDSQVRSCM